MDRLDKLQNAATRKKEQKEEKHRRRRETIRYIISLIWEAFQKVLFLLLLVSAIIVGEILGGVAKFVISIVFLYFTFFLILEVTKGKSEPKPDIKNLFKGETIFFCVLCFIITAIVYSCVSFFHAH